MANQEPSRSAEGQVSGVRPAMRLTHTLFLTCMTDSPGLDDPQLQVHKITEGGPLLFSLTFLYRVEKRDENAARRFRSALSWIHQKMKGHPGEVLTIVLVVPNDVSSDPFLKDLTPKEIEFHLERAAKLLRLHFLAHRFPVETSFDLTQPASNAECTAANG